MTFLDYAVSIHYITIGTVGLTNSKSLIDWLTASFRKGAWRNVLRFLVGWAVYVLFLTPIVHAGVIIGEINAR